MKNPHKVSADYRDRWSELPKGQNDLNAGDIVDMQPYSGIGSIHVIKEDGTSVYVSGFSGYILKKL